MYDCTDYRLYNFIYVLRVRHTCATCLSRITYQEISWLKTDIFWGPFEISCLLLESETKGCQALNCKSLGLQFAIFQVVTVSWKWFPKENPTYNPR